VPDVRDRSWVRTPLDAFVLARLEAAQLRPAPPADRRTLLRRVYLDLIGLPPTQAEQAAFLTDPSPYAYAHVVDRLLARPEYGERWARHWLDVVRYAESNGYERDGAKPSAWRYRDYVIDAFNADKPYDCFLLEQLAGDEMPGSNAQTHIATTFLRLGTWDDEPANAVVDRYDQLDDVLGTTVTAFLGLTLRCARCHDHKFEPFSQADYYRMLAVFEPLKRPQEGRTELDLPVGTEEELAVYKQALARAETAENPVRQKIEGIEKPIRTRLFQKGGEKGATRSALPADAQVAFQVEPAKRSTAQKELVKKFAVQLEQEVRSAATSGEQRQREELYKQLTAAQKTRPAELPHAYIWHEEGATAPATHLFKRGNPNYAATEVQAGLPAVLLTRPLPPPQPLKHSTGRRLWLARWIACAENPLTARVIVNRIWMHHFGKGLVVTPNDFGVMGEAPTHPELLDYLAARFVAGGWRLKDLHRLIVLSNAYQTSSLLEGSEKAGDQQRALFGRWRQRRLEAEAVRDSILAVSGQLSRQQGGPSVFPPLPRAVLEGQSRPGEGWGKSDPRQAARRSIYVFSKRSLVLPELDLLDAPDTTASCDTRPRSTTAPQALTFLNGAFLQEQADHFAHLLEREAGKDPSAQVERAFVLALCRSPRPEEARLAQDFLTRQEKQIQTDGKGPIADARHRAMAAFCLVLLNTNEFVYPG
jgi:hypothetical protein